MITRKRLLLTLILLGSIAWTIHWRRRAAYLSNPLPQHENTGAFAGPLAREGRAYDPTKPPSRPWIDPRKASPARTQYRTFTASSLNGLQTDYRIYLPPGYDDPSEPDRRYPVVYWLHGWNASPEGGEPFVDALDQAIRAGCAPPVIAVIPNGLNDSWYCDSVDGSQPVESVIVKDLIPTIDSTWRTIPDRRGRALEGFSMGGWGAGHLAFKYPDLFSAVTMVSPPFHPHNAFPQLGRVFSGDAAAYYAEDPVTIARREPSRLKESVRIRLLVGDCDGNLGYVHAFAVRLKEWGIPHEYTVVPGVAHNDADLYDHLSCPTFSFYNAVFATASK